MSDIVNRKLIDGSVMELGRYHSTFEAYDYITEDGTMSVIALGSSKIREAFDGIEMEKHSIHEDVGFYNLGLAGERPYIRLVELDSIISSNPEVIVLEFGPNTLSALNDPLEGSNLEKMNSLLFHRPLTDSNKYHEALSDADKEVLELSFSDKFDGYSRYTFPAIENAIIDSLHEESTGWECDETLNNVRCAPHPSSPLYSDYLRKPPQFSDFIQRSKDANDGSLEEFYGERLDKYIKSSFHNPEGIYNKNQNAYEYIIDKALENDIEVILLGLPYNPVLMNRLTPNQWQYMYNVLENYSSREDIHVLDYINSSYFHNDSFFNDFSHMSELGEKQLTSLLLPLIDEVLSQEKEPTRPMDYPIPLILPPTIYEIESTIELNVLEPRNKTSGSGPLSNHEWVEWNDVNSTGLSVFPNDGKSTTFISESPRLTYCFEIYKADTYSLYLQSKSPDPNSDSVWLGQEGTPIDTGARGIGFYRANNPSNWAINGDDGNRLELELTSGENCIDFWMREDGVVLTRILLSTNSDLDLVT